MAKLYPDEEPFKWICFECLSIGPKAPCILIVHAAGTPHGCPFPDSGRRKPKWELCCKEKPTNEPLLLPQKRCPNPLCQVMMFETAKVCWNCERVQD